MEMGTCIVHASLKGMHVSMNFLTVYESGKLVDDRGVLAVDMRLASVMKPGTTINTLLLHYCHTMKLNIRCMTRTTTYK
jgi:hypothetical protein